MSSSNKDVGQNWHAIPHLIIIVHDLMVGAYSHNERSMKSSLKSSLKKLLDYTDIGVETTSELILGD